MNISELHTCNLSWYRLHHSDDSVKAEILLIHYYVGVVDSRTGCDYEDHEVQEAAMELQYKYCPFFGQDKNGECFFFSIINTMALNLVTGAKIITYHVLVPR